MSGEIDNKTVECGKIDIGEEWKKNYGLLIGRARNLARGSQQEPEDILSQAMVKVLNYLRTEREVTNFVGLMMMSMTQVHIDTKRRMQEQVFIEAVEYQDYSEKLGAQSETPSIERSYSAKQSLANIQTFLSEWPAIYREIFHMRFVMEMSFSTISQALSISEANARQKIRCLRVKLQASELE